MLCFCGCKGFFRFGVLVWTSKSHKILTISGWISKTLDGLTSKKGWYIITAKSCDFIRVGFFITKGRANPTQESSGRVWRLGCLFKGALAVEPLHTLPPGTSSYYQTIGRGRVIRPPKAFINNVISLTKWVGCGGSVQCVAFGRKNWYLDYKWSPREQIPIRMCGVACFLQRKGTHIMII